jgi:chorismate mutase
MSLDELRRDLDEVDDLLIDLLAQRAELVAAIWDWKQKNGVDRIDPVREQALRERLLSRAEASGLSREAVEAVLAQIIGKPLR